MPNLKYVKIKSHDLDMLCWTSIRYALGRRSYIVSWITTVVENHLQFLKEPTVTSLIKEIEEYPDLGHYCDKTCWELLLSKLRMHKALIFNKSKEAKTVRFSNSLLNGRLDPRKG